MNAVRIRTHLQSETPHLPEIRPLVGKDVEIIVLDEGGEKPPEPNPVGECPLRGSVLYDEDPFAPVAESDWEALR